VAILVNGYVHSKTSKDGIFLACSKDMKEKVYLEISEGGAMLFRD
jgi:hypothetical protein